MRTINHDTDYSTQPGNWT